MLLRVISFNIRCCDDIDGNSIAERAPRLAAVTAPFHADVMGFQEYRPAWEPHLRELFGKDYDMFWKHRCQIDKEATPILWRKDRFDCLERGYFWLSDTPDEESQGWDALYNCHRICVFVLLQDKQTGKTFRFINTHLGFGDQEQVKSSALILQRCGKTPQYPNVLVGDFNMIPDSPGYNRMVQENIDVNAATVCDMGTTFHGYHPETVTNEHIDYCFVDPRITPIGQTIIRDTVDGKYPSDHFGLFALLDI